MTSPYQRLSCHPAEEVLAARAVVIAEGGHFKVGGLQMKCASKRYDTFAKGRICAGCGLEGTYFAIERHAVGDYHTWHLNLYGVDEQGIERMFTRDHILPKSRGGNDTLANSRTMCSPCNNKKGNMIDVPITMEQVRKLSSIGKISHKEMPHLKGTAVYETLVEQEAARITRKKKKIEKEKLRRARIKAAKAQCTEEEKARHHIENRRRGLERQAQIHAEQMNKPIRRTLYMASGFIIAVLAAVLLLG